MSLDTHTKINRHVQIPLGLCQGRACDVKKKKETKKKNPAKSNMWGTRCGDTL